jgi:hypothetical protein
MLGCLCAMMREYENRHGCRPDLLRINRAHFERLRRHFSDPDDVETMMAVLNLTLMFSEDAVAPALARIARPGRPRPLTRAGSGAGAARPPGIP